MPAEDRRIPDVIQVNLVLDEVQTLLSALSKEDNVHPSLQRYVLPLQIKLEAAERKIYDVRRARRISQGLSL